MRNGLFFATVLCLLLAWAGLAIADPVHLDAPRDLDAKIAPELRAELAALQPGEMITVIVTLQAQARLDRATQASGADRDDRLQAVIVALRATADEAQRSIRALLSARQSQGLAGPVTYFWVFNGLSVTATGEVIRELATRSEVAKITPDTIQIVPAAQAAPNPPEPNLSVVNAPALWALGFRGQGIVVANLDSGVDVSHPDLAGRWRAGANSWFDPYGQHPVTPTDLTGHGTQTMGVMVGGDLGGTAIGVAPEAQWIAVKIWNDQGRSTATAIHLGFQWLLDPDGNPETADAPHVVNNSWTLAYPGCNLEFEPDLLAFRAAGILPVFSAGNGGPSPGTDYSPANNPSAFAVGGTDDGDLIYALSSRGPSSCGEPGTIFPDLVAPGVAIRTTDLSGSYYDGTGTSLAAPHVSGGLALLLSALPTQSAVALESALMSGAVDLGSQGPDNDFGNGRLDLLASYETAAAGADLAISKRDALDPVSTNAVLTYTLYVTNTGPAPATAVTITDELPLGVSYGGAAGDGWGCGHSMGIVTCTKPSFAAGAAAGIVITVTAPASSGTITNSALIASNTADPRLTNNMDVERTLVTPPTPPVHHVLLPLVVK